MLHLDIDIYDILDELKETVMYYNINSMIHINYSTNNIETGCLLGEWIDEFDKDNYNNDWVNSRLKCYIFLFRIKFNHNISFNLIF